MSAVSLGKADLALFSDLTQRVTVPHLLASPQSRGYAGTTVQFAGDTLPTPFRGTTRRKSWAMTARYLRTEQAGLLALIQLVETAADAPDSRLLLRTHYGQAAGLDESVAVVIFNLEPAAQMGLYADLSFTAEAVQYTLEV
jgi:hypothetical protein